MSPSVFDPLPLRGITWRNRFGVSPMCQYSSVDGHASDWHLVHLGARAVGGSGAVFTEAAAVEATGRISPGDLGLYQDSHHEMLERVVRFVKEQGAAVGIQLAHAGRKASTTRPWDGNRAARVSDEGGWDAVDAPSAIAFSDTYPLPRALDHAGIRRVVHAFRAGAQRARDIGFDMVEIHAAHGYLLHQFLSPLSNHRTDEYGGSFDNRVRVVLDTVRAVREVWPDSRPLLLRVSATDWVEGGWTVDDTVELVRRARPLGIDMIDCSSGGSVPSAVIPVGPGYQTPFAARVRRETGVPTAAVGMITGAAQADQIIRTEQADCVLLARQMLREPYFALHAAHELGADIRWPRQYQRAKP